MTTNAVAQISFASSPSVNGSIQQLASIYGLNLDSFYYVDQNGNKVLDVQKWEAALKEAQEKKDNNTINQATQADSFQKTTTVTGVKTEAEQVENSRETIDEEYKKAIKDYYKFLNANKEENSNTEKKWDELKNMKFDLTKTGVTNATVIAGVSEFISKLQETVKNSKNTVEENKKQEKVDSAIAVDTQEDIYMEENKVETYAANFFNNPFYASAYETTEIEEETSVA